MKTILALFCVLLFTHWTIASEKNIGKPPADEADKNSIAAELAKHLATVRSADAANVETAKEALNVFDKTSVAILREHLKKETHIAAAEALAARLTVLGEKFVNADELSPEVGREIHRRCGPLATAKNFEEADKALRELLKFGGAPAPWLFPAMRNPHVGKMLRLRAARALAAMNYDETAPILTAALDNEDTADEVRDELLSLGATAVTSLRTRGLTHFSPEVRRRAAMLLGWLGAALSAEKECQGLAGDLLKLTADNNKETAREAATALANLRDTPTFSALAKSVRQTHTSDPFLVHSFGVALAVSAGTSELRELFSLLNERRATVREIAAIAIGLWCDAHKEALQGGDGAEAARLLRGLLRDASSGVQQRAAEALGVLAGIGEREALNSVEELRNVLLRGRAECRLAAALALGEAAAKGAATDDATTQRFMQITKLPRLSHAAGLCRAALMTVTEQSGGAVAAGTAPIPESRLKMIAEKKEKYEEDKKKKDSPPTVAENQPGFRYRDAARICCVCPNKRPQNTTSPATMPSEPVRPPPKTAPIDGIETADNNLKKNASASTEPEHRAPMSATNEGEKKAGESSGSTKSVAPPIAPDAQKAPGIPGTRRHVLGTGVNPYDPETGWIFTTYLRVLDE